VVALPSGHRIHYEDEGQGDAVLFLHGLAGASNFWRGTLDAVSPTHHCIAPDLLGFGDSDKPRSHYAIAEHGQMVARITEHLGLGRLHLIGHSMGGMVAIHYVLRFPRQVKRLVLINTPVSGGRALHGRGRIGATWLGLLAVKVGLQFPPILWALRQLPQYYFVLDPRYTEDAKKAPLHSLKGNADALRRTDLSARLREIAVPTLVIGTDRDGIVRASEFALAAREIPGARHVRVDDAGHCPTLERPEQTHAAILGFLQA
jgi:pimeloyl-ACP methyl ester carboxylesterase